jgi:hypothetical protein
MCLLAIFRRVPYAFPGWEIVLDTYRAFILDANDRIVRAEVLSAASDEDAMAAAQPLSLEADIEIWRGSRRIGRVPKGRETAPPPAVKA